jgi:UDP-N-acetylmuramyl tripeptide synthase
MELLQRLRAQGAMIERLVSDSRRCAPGVAFFAYPGEKADGRAHIPDALARGASAVVWEANSFAWRAEWGVPNASVPELKQRAGELASAFHGHPSHTLWMCGVTGTNGKTSCSQWLAAALTRHGAKSGVIGTLGSGYPSILGETGNTTPDALDKVLQTLRPVADERGGRLTVVFGAGGDRDPAKRPLMGEAAARHADRIVITSDNPRSEDPLRIIEAVVAGAGAGALREPDRRRAIESAIADARVEDVVVIAGKGHESYQEIAGRRLPFSDQDVARAALGKR